MGKYIIEVDESEIVECWNEQAAKELGYQEYALKKYPKIKVKPYNPSGDLVSREAVKNYARKVMYEQNATNFSLLKMFDEIIDNAPASEAFTLEDMQNNFDLGAMSEAGKHDRPKGEWVKIKEDRMSIDMSGELVTQYKCSKCGRYIVTLPSKLVDYPFCHCGADMREDQYD